MDPCETQFNKNHFLFFAAFFRSSSSFFFFSSSLAFLSSISFLALPDNFDTSGARVCPLKRFGSVPQAYGNTIKIKYRPIEDREVVIGVAIILIVQVLDSTAVPRATNHLLCKAIRNLEIATSRQESNTPVVTADTVTSTGPVLSFSPDSARSDGVGAPFVDLSSSTRGLDPLSQTFGTASTEALMSTLLDIVCDYGYGSVDLMPASSQSRIWL